MPSNETTLGDMSYKELQAECRSLGLSASGNAKLLRRRISSSNRHENPKRRKVDPSDDLICPITLELPVDPVTARDGRIYERRAIEKHFANCNSPNPRSPVTNEPIGRELFPNPQIKSLIESLIKCGSITGARARQWKENKNKPDIVWDAEGGDVEAMYSAGRSYYVGDDGFKVNYKLAFKWSDQASKAGSVPAMALLGHIYHKGHGVERNDALGMMHTLSAAEKGSNYAAYRLGFMFHKGLYGAPKDRERAIYWLKKAVDPDAKCKTLNDNCLQEAKELLEEREGGTDTA